MAKVNYDRLAKSETDTMPETGEGAYMRIGWGFCGALVASSVFWWALWLAVSAH